MKAVPMLSVMLPGISTRNILFFPPFFRTCFSFGVLQSGPLMLERKLLSAASHLAVSVRCLIGPDMVEGGMSNPDAMAGTNGLIFLICHDSTSTELTKRRLHEVMKAKRHYGGIPVAILMTEYVDSEKMKVDLDIEALMHETGIRVGEIFHRIPKCKSGLEDMVSKVYIFVNHSTK